MNEIKVGQWVRYRDSYGGCVRIGGIETVEDRISPQQDVTIIDLDYYIPRSNVLKTADKLVDLLEVGDIVHLESNKYFSTTVIINKSYIDNIKTEIKHGYKITAIELHENRVKQVIGNG